MTEKDKIDLCLFIPEGTDNTEQGWFKITIPKHWLKQNPQRTWQLCLPENVYTIRIAESMLGISIRDISEYPIDEYLRELFKDYPEEWDMLGGFED